LQFLTKDDEEEEDHKAQVSEMDDGEVTESDEETDTDDEFSPSVRQVRRESRERSSLSQKSPKSQTRSVFASGIQPSSSFNRSLPPKKEKKSSDNLQKVERRDSLEGIPQPDFHRSNLPPIEPGDVDPQKVDGLDIIPRDSSRHQYGNGNSEFDHSNVPDSVLADAQAAGDQSKKCIVM